MRLTTSDTWYSSGHNYGVEKRRVDDMRLLSPLKARLRQYDSLRLTLELQGGDVSDIKAITELLQEPILVGTQAELDSTRLTDPVRLRSLVSMIGWGSLFLEIRRLSHGLPAYYLSRVTRDYWSEYSLIVEDLYLSPDFPFADHRFARPMNMGHEICHLRMSQFRSQVLTRYCQGAAGRDQYADDMLYDVGHYCLAAMWHEDQRPAMIAAKHFGLPRFLQAIELLYLCLSADLCNVRSHVSPQMTDFFKHIYPQRAVCTFLETLPARNGKDINALPHQAARSFSRLSCAFREFLETDVQGLRPKHESPQMTLGLGPGSKARDRRPSTIPFYKLFFANLYQPEQISDSLEKDKGLRKAARNLEKCSRTIIDQINQSKTPVDDDPPVWRPDGQVS